jgi:hypothetical protein
MVVTANNFPSCEKSNAEAIVSVNSQYAKGLYFMANSRSFLFVVMGRADEESDLWSLRRGAGTLDG